MHDARDRNAGIWIEPGDRLYVAAYSSVASLAVRFSGYFRNAKGDVSEYAVTLNPTSDRAVIEGNVVFGAGFLLSCVASLASGNAHRGQCYVRAQVQRSAGTPAVKLHQVIGGYVTDDYAPSFPYGKIEGPLEGPGYLRVITGTDPVAGADFSETVPTGARWRLQAVEAFLQTDATVGNRYVALDINAPDTTFLLELASTQAQVASKGYSYYWQPNGDRYFSAQLNAVGLPLPALWLGGGAVISGYALDKAGGDDWGAPVITAEEWIEA